MKTQAKPHGPTDRVLTALANIVELAAHGCCTCQDCDPYPGCPVHGSDTADFRIARRWLKAYGRHRPTFED